MNEDEFRRKKEKIKEEMIRRRRERTGQTRMNEMDILELEFCSGEKWKMQRSEDIENARVRMHELRQRQQRVEVETGVEGEVESEVGVEVEKPVFSCDIFRKFQRDREEVLERMRKFAQSEENLKKIKDFLEKNEK